MTDIGMSLEPRLLAMQPASNSASSTTGRTVGTPWWWLTAMTPDDLRGHIERHGVDDVVNDLLEEVGDTWDLVYPGLESGQLGHYHPGDVEPDLSPSVLTRTSEYG